MLNAQEEDGYLGTYFTIEEPDRKFRSLMNSHELYCAGHFMEAAAEQDSAEGHAVRLVYLCTAMADVAASTQDQSMLDACRKIWRNIVDRRMYSPAEDALREDPVRLNFIPYYTWANRGSNEMSVWVRSL